MRVAVIVPGIMGSVLWDEDATGKRVEIWGENFYDNYRRILTHPELLRGNIQRAAVPDVTVEQHELANAALIQRIDDVFDEENHRLGMQ